MEKEKTSQTHEKKNKPQTNYRAPFIDSVWGSFLPCFGGEDGFWVDLPALHRQLTASQPQGEATCPAPAGTHACLEETPRRTIINNNKQRKPGGMPRLATAAATGGDAVTGARCPQLGPDQEINK